MIIVVMGVAGSGKTTIGRLLAFKLDWPFFEGDDFHSKANIEKMAQGTPLNDEDRADWLSAIAGQIRLLEKESRSGVIACSALKNSYRIKLSKAAKDIKFVFLRGDYELLQARLESRKGHFMKPTMLKSQFETLEEPENSIDIDIKDAPEKIVEDIIQTLSVR
jgi:gluconokinase